MKGKARIRGAVSIAAIFLVVTGVMAYDLYSTNIGGTGNCAACHGAFTDTPYVSNKGETWSDSLHDIHRNTMLDGDCDTCHTSGGRAVDLGSSNGGVDFPAISCVGCHGRAEDGTGSGSQGYGAGLRQHHFNTGAATCDGVGCHADSDPANKTVVGEEVLPPYYTPDPDPNHPLKPTDPCNPAPGFPENFEGSTAALDNDGDNAYDEADTDCGAVVATPGATDSLLVTAKDTTAGTISISYGTACVSETSDNTIEYGDLAQVSTYTYAGQECNIGTTGSYTWNYPAGSVFFMVVGNNNTVEGSYGLDSTGVERPEDATSATCPVPQDLTNRCDP